MLMKLLRLTLVIVAIETCSSPSLSANWEISIDQKTGLPLLSHGGSSALSSQFVFWSHNWAWADLSLRFDTVSPYVYTIAGSSTALNLSLDGVVKKSLPQQLSWKIDLNARAALSDVIGGGMSFRASPSFCPTTEAGVGERQAVLELRCGSIRRSRPFISR
jgi:hypothetical protein